MFKKVIDGFLADSLVQHYRHHISKNVIVSPTSIVMKHAFETQIVRDQQLLFVTAFHQHLNCLHAFDIPGKYASGKSPICWIDVELLAEIVKLDKNALLEQRLNVVQADVHINVADRDLGRVHAGAD